MPYPVIWGENKRHGKITELKARDYNSDENGPPKSYDIPIVITNSGTPIDSRRL